MDLRDQRIVILGGTSGIGLATAHLLSEAGANIIIAGRSPPLKALSLVRS